MTAAPDTLDPPLPPPPRTRRPSALQATAYVLVSAAVAWFLLRELAPILRPLLLAVFLGYVLMPYHARLRKHVPGAVSLVLLAGLTAAAVVGLAVAVYASVLGLNEQVPQLRARTAELAQDADRWLAANAPWLADQSADGKRLEQRLTEQAQPVIGSVLNLAADVLLEACVVALYLMFLLLGAAEFPDRVRRAYSPERADDILHLAGQVNAAIVSYLKAKVKSSLFLAVPVGLVLTAFGVKFALLWAVLTFLCNFVPYIGSVVAYSLPVGFAFLQLDLDWRPVTAAVLLLGCHVGSASVVEPMLLGRAVGLSPLVVLASLAFWGLLWGIPGMFLAVPLTVVAVIVMGHIRFTRPVAKLLGGG